MRLSDCMLFAVFADFGAGQELVQRVFCWHGRGPAGWTVVPAFRECLDTGTHDLETGRGRGGKVIKTSCRFCTWESLTIMRDGGSLWNPIECWGLHASWMWTHQHYTNQNTLELWTLFHNNHFLNVFTKNSSLMNAREEGGIKEISRLRTPSLDPLNVLVYLNIKDTLIGPNYVHYRDSTAFVLHMLHALFSC